jgi:hypothetical protein
MASTPRRLLIPAPAIANGFLTIVAFARESKSKSAATSWSSADMLVVFAIGRFGSADNQIAEPRMASESQLV